MTTPSFEELYNKLNKAQKEAVDNIEGPVMVIAGPGTGKTQILTIRIANILLKTQVNPENILALTFTESGVLAMRKRLVEIIGTAGYKVEINTFHGFCNNVILNNPEDFPSLISSESIVEVEQLQILEKIILENQFNLIKPFGDPFYYLKSLLSAINDLKKEGVGVKDLEKGISQQEKDFGKVSDLHHEKGVYKGQVKGKYLELKREIEKNKELLKVYQLYQKALSEQKKYDFSDMLIEVVAALQKNKELLMRLQERYQYILVDEHQDTNTAQNKLVELLALFYKNPNLFVVGDEKQAIYRFQGASLENFLYFKELYPEAKLINLEENYRSSQTILNAAASLIQKNITSEILAKNISLKANAKYPEEPIRVAGLTDYYAEIYFVVYNTLEKIKLGVSPKEIAILARNNKDLTPFVEALEQQGVPYIVESDQNIFIDPDIRKLVLLFEAICSFGKDLQLILAMHIDFLNIDQLDLYRLMAESRSKKISLYQLLSDKNKVSEMELRNKTSILDFYKKINSWKSLCDNENLPGVFIKILNDSGLLKNILKKKNYQDVLERVDGLFQEAKMQWEKNSRFTLKGFLSYLKLLEEHEILIRKRTPSIYKDAVRVMTAHRAKGLEFDFVYIVNCFDGHWGNLKRRTKGFKIPWEYLGIKLKLDVEIEEDEDERRLFYVALTRARKGVMLSYSTSSLDGKEQIPSQYIFEIDDKLKTSFDTSDFEKKFLSQKEIIFAPPLESLEKDFDKKFFKDLFLERGLSATSLNNYLECPWKYFYNNLLDLPEPQNKSATFGSAIHQALSAYIRKNKKVSPTLEFLLESFREALKKQVAESSVDFSELASKGNDVLSQFFKSVAKNWPKTLLSEVKIGGVYLEISPIVIARSKVTKQSKQDRHAPLAMTDASKISLNGKIDIIEPLKNGVKVYDLKTGDILTRNQIMGQTKNSTGDYFRQLTFYKLILDKEGKWRMKEGVIQFVEPDKKGQFHQEAFKITEQDLKNLTTEIKRVADEILDLSFWDKRCGKKDCEYCYLREVMIS